MKLQVLTKVLMATAIAFSITATASQPSSASRPAHPDPCPARNSDDCNTSKHPTVCDDDDRDNCQSQHPNVCDDDDKDNCQSQHPNVCDDDDRKDCTSQHPNVCNSERSQTCDDKKVQTCNTQYPNTCNTNTSTTEPQKPQTPTQPTSTAHNFFCRADNGVPTTFVETQGRTYPVIRWVSTYFSAHGYEPQTRCRQVSAKFQQFYNNGTLNYITTGTVNRQPVICVSNTKDGPCTGVLFTLKSQENANRIIQQLFDIRAGAAGPLEESGSRIYFDMNKYLKTLTGLNRSTTSVSSPTPSQHSGRAW